MTTTVEQFWIKWLQADELEQVKLLETLTMPSNVIRDKELHQYHCAALFNRYLEDMVMVLSSMSPEQLDTYFTPYRRRES